MIIGLTGKFAAGKGTVAEALERRGFRYHSLSDVLRDELARRGVPESRRALLALGNELREAEGPAALAKRIKSKIAAAGDEDHIVDSIRNPAEVEALRTMADFTMIGVDADPRVRYDRLVARGRQGDPTTFDEFSALEAKETVSDNPAAQQLAATFALADLVIANDGTVDQLMQRVDQVLSELNA